MADHSNFDTDRRDFHYSRWRLAKFAAGSFGVTALTAFVTYWSAATVYWNAATVIHWSAATWYDTLGSVLAIVLALPGAAIGLFGVAFFGMILIVAVSAFFDRAPVVTITANSIHDRRWGGPPVPWSEVRGITGILIDSMDGSIAAGHTAIVVDDPSRYYRPRGLFARFAYGAMRNPLYFNMVALDGTDMDLATDLVARVPDKIPRSTAIWRLDQGDP